MKRKVLSSEDHSVNKDVSMSKLNQYGDNLVKTTGQHGADISSQRIDDLDRQALEYVLQKSDVNPKGMDVGCGFGIQGIRFALLGADMTLIDILDIQSRIQSISADLFVGNRLSYLKKDARELSQAEFPVPFDFVYSQRFIHYLTYQEATKLIALVSGILQPGGHIFISASGIHSELGNNYRGKNTPIDNRYFSLSPHNADKHNIVEKVCLYSEDELSELLSNHQFRIKSIWTSSFGNIKAIANKI